MDGKNYKQKFRTTRMMKLQICNEQDCQDGWFPDTMGTNYIPSSIVPFSAMQLSLKAKSNRP